MLLIFPPVAKSCEPPAGIAKLANALASHELPCTIVDMNLEGLLYLLGQPLHAPDTWSRRAIKNRPHSLAALRDGQTYLSPDRYGRAVMDLSRVLEISGRGMGVHAGLADYHDGKLSPVRSADLIEAAEHPELNLFYPYFKERLPEIIEGSLSRKSLHVHDDPPPSSFLNGGGSGNVQARSLGIRDPPLFKGGPGRFAVIGFSLNYLSQALTTFAMIGFIRKEFPGATIVLGGGLVTSWMKRPGWKDPFHGLVDRLIAGPGEGPLLSLYGIEHAGQFQASPDYTALLVNDYLSPGFILPYAGSSGCFWNKCSFCPEPAEDNPYLPIPPVQAMAELNSLISKTGPVLVHMLDNAVSPAFMRSLAESPPCVPWYGFARIGRELADLDFCLALKRSGCVMLKLGLESGDQDLLDRMEKGIDLETASQALRNLQKAGISTYVYLLFGTPSETPAEARRTLDFVIRHQEAVTFLNLAIFNLPVCSKEAGLYPTEPFYEGDLSLYRDFRHPLGWNRKQVRQFLESEFKKHPAVSAIIRNDPPVFTSNHAAFFSQGWKKR
jgi:hypothetical protein